MPKPLSHYYRRLRTEGLGAIAARRFRRYKDRFQVNNPLVGRAVELFGNRVRMDGMTFSVDCPQISRAHKSTLLFGLHEMEERALIRRWLPRDMPVIELGGGLGVVSCLINRGLLDRNRQLVVEANPAMAQILERNRDANGCGFKVVNKAIAYGGAWVDLNIDEAFVGSSIAAGGGNTIKVRATDVSSLLSEMNFAGAGIVCDIEGSEADVIKREIPILGDRVRFFMAEMHPRILGADAVETLLNDLVTLGFTLKQRMGDSVFLARN